MKTNHLARNLVTKGFLNISLITKGFILPFIYEVVTKKRRRTGGGGLAGNPYKGLVDDVIQLKKEEEIDYIKVYVKWNKKVNRDKKVYVELIKKEIRAELINIDKDVEIKVELDEMEDIKPTIDVKLDDEK